MNKSTKINYRRRPAAVLLLGIKQLGGLAWWPPLLFLVRNCFGIKQLNISSFADGG
jgi:hypothetical protein